MNKKQIQSDGLELANEHWNYIEKLLRAHGVSDREICMIRFHYVTAFVHGYKHGKES